MQAACLRGHAVDKRSYHPVGQCYAEHGQQKDREHRKCGMGARAAEKNTGVGIEHHHPVAGTDLFVRHDETAASPGIGSVQALVVAKLQLLDQFGLQFLLGQRLFVVPDVVEMDCDAILQGRDLEAAVGLDVVEEPLHDVAQPVVPEHHEIDTDHLHGSVADRRRDHDQIVAWYAQGSGGIGRPFRPK